MDNFEAFEMENRLTYYLLQINVDIFTNLWQFQFQFKPKTTSYLLVRTLFENYFSFSKINKY